MSKVHILAAGLPRSRKMRTSVSGSCVQLSQKIQDIILQLGKKIMKGGSEHVHSFSILESTVLWPA